MLGKAMKPNIPTRKIVALRIARKTISASLTSFPQVAAALKGR
jgi:hypothetical protein